jgi:hypothetical protein
MMRSEDRDMSMQKILVWLAFVSAPSMVLVGYAVYKMKEIFEVKYGVLIDDSLYGFILLFAVYGSTWITSKRLWQAVKGDRTNGVDKKN